MLNNKYDWQPYFRELAEKLLLQKDKQNDFGQWLDEYILSKPQGEFWNPISIIQLFLSKNKDVLRVDKQKLAELLKGKLEIESVVPKTLNVLELFLSKTYIYEDTQLIKDAHDAIWPFFEELMNNEQPTQSMFSVFETKHIASDIFSACFLVKPEVYLPTSDRVRYLDKERKLPTIKESKNSNPTYEEYLAYREEVNSAMNEWSEQNYADVVMKSLLYHFSRNAESAITNSGVWLIDMFYAKKRGDWELFVSQNVWGTRGDKNMDSYNSFSEFVENYYRSGEATTKIKMLYGNYAPQKQMKIGDIIIARNGEKILLGYGIIQSQCRKCEETSILKYCMDVKWHLKEKPYSIKHKGVWFNEIESDEYVPMLEALNAPQSLINQFSTSHNKQMNSYETYITLLKENYNLVLTGAPGTGKTYLAKEIASYWIAEKPYNEIAEDKELTSRIGFVQFHPSYDYTDFVEGLRPINQNGTLGFERRDGYFKAFCKKALEDAPNTYIMIIDEINRGELSKIFGELFYSIDPGYRGTSGKVATQYQNMLEDIDSFKDGFFIPDNVYIIGTMNDIDRSVESMDFAMRRRFVWKEVTPESRVEMLESLGKHKEEAMSRMNSLNREISKTQGLGTAFQIGPAYFRKLKDGNFSKLWEMNLEPLLREYLRGMSKVEETMKKFESAYNNQLPVFNDELDPTE